MLKILWLVNIKLPEISIIQGKINTTYVGGWLSGLYNSLIQSEEIEKIIICYPINDISEHGESLKTIFSSFDISDDQKLIRNNFIDIIDKYKPDIIHIHGTEYDYSYIMQKAADDLGIGDRTVCSIQGLVSIYAEHFFGGMEEHEYRKKTVYERIKRKSLMDTYHDYCERGKSEIELLKSTSNVIGRTSWDKACTYLINPEANYYHCNEILRSNFYTGKWEYAKCEKHSIMLSQGAKPIKGLQMAIKAMSIIVGFYPDTIMYVAGNNILDNKVATRNSYVKYIKDLIGKYNLANKVVFTGALQAEEMKQRMLNTNVFLLPSSIENSPNSLGEAMMLGVPCVASDVGGVSGMMKHEVEGYIYPFNEYYKMAYYIIEIFNKEAQIEEMGFKAARKARITHNPEINTKELLKIYHKVVQGRWV